jgi:hypothetical protein
MLGDRRGRRWSSAKGTSAVLLRVACVRHPVDYSVPMVVRSPRASSLRIRTLASLLVVVSAAVAQSPSPAALAEFEKRRTKVLAEAGQRHLELGSWARDAGLVPQATTQFLRAVEVSEGKNPGASTVLGVMRGYGDAFWKRKVARPSKATLDDYARRAASIEARSRKEHVELAERAGRLELLDRAREHWRTALELGAELAVDERGGFRIDKKKVEAELAPWLQELSTKDTTGKPRFEAAGARAPRLAELAVHEDPALQVRTDLPGDAAQRLHALGSALLPHLRERLDGVPPRQLVLVVFGKHADYTAYLEACGMADAKVARGVTDYGTFQSLACAQRRERRDARRRGVAVDRAARADAPVLPRRGAGGHAGLVLGRPGRELRRAGHVHLGRQGAEGRRGAAEGTRCGRRARRCCRSQRCSTCGCSC